MLTDFCVLSEDLCMRTTLDFEDNLFREAKARAAELGEPLTRLLERSLRLYLHGGNLAESTFRFAPLIKSGRSTPGVDWDDRDALFERMEERG